MNISRCYQWHLSLTHKRRTHIHRFILTIKIRNSVALLFERTSIRVFFVEKFVILLLRSFEWIWKMVSNYAIVSSKPSTVADLFVHNLNMFLSVFIIIIIIIIIVMIPKCTPGIVALSRGSLLNPFHHMLILLFIRSWVLIVGCITVLCVCFGFVIKWAHIRDRKWNIANFYCMILDDDKVVYD